MAEKKKDIIWRVNLVFLVFFVFGFAIISRVVQLQFVEGKHWKSLADSTSISYKTIEPLRGNIYAADGGLLATSLPRYDVNLDLMAGGIKPQLFNEKIDSLALCLSKLFKDKSKNDYKRILKEARRDKDRYFLLKRNISFNDQRALHTFPLLRMGRNRGGLIITQLSRREKPFKLLASRTIGSKIENKNVKAVGIEGSFDSNLKGIKGQRLMQRIANGVWKPVNDQDEIEAKDGQDVITTIDLNLQDVAENALMKQLSVHDADMGCAILMEVATGHIKAIANLKRVGKGDDDFYQEEFNYAIGQATEPGSTFKLISLMAAMEDGFIDLDDSVDTYGGKMLLPGGIYMRDSHEGLYGKLSVKKTFAVSSNVGVSSLIMKYYSKDPQKFIDRINSFDINDDYKLQLAGETKPYIKNTKAKSWSKVSLPFMSIGYELKLTPLQILTFYNTVANNGKMVEPLFVKEIRSKSQVIKSYPTHVLADSLFSPNTIKMARKMLESVVEDGTASHIKHAQYSIAGKTGTAQIAQGADGYKNGKVKYQASFCGYFPADKPQYSCIVVVYAPGKDVYYGSSIACPVFKEISDKVFALNVKMHDELKIFPDSLFNGKAIVKAGKNNPTTIAANGLKIKVPADNTGWHDVKYSSFQIKEDIVPNVIGMGLRDAIYLLESQGLQVKPIGRGAVVRQSLNAGSRIIKGQQIIIDLG